METTTDASLMENIFLLIFTLLFMGFPIYYCNKIARQLKMNQITAVLAGLFISYIGVLLYSNLAHKAKKQSEEIK